MHQAVYETLKEVARAKRVIYYSEVAPLASVDLNAGRGRWEIGRIVGEICKGEVHQGHPMLGAVVVRKDTNMPGEGFFNIAKKLGLFQGGNKDKRGFWIQELERVHSYWSSH